MRASTRVLVTLGVLVAVGLTVLLLLARPAITSVLAGAAVAEDPPEIRTPVVLDDPADVLAATEARGRVSHQRFTPVSGECLPETLKDTANLGHVFLMQPSLGQGQEPAIFHDIVIHRLTEDMKVILPVHFACKDLRINDLRRDGAVDVLLDYEDKWKKLCADAGSAATVEPSAADALRSERRDALAILTGYDEADKLLAAIQSNLGF